MRASTPEGDPEVLHKMMRRMSVSWLRRLPCLSLTVLAATLAACDDGPTTPSRPAPNLVVQLTDAPAASVDQINLVFTTVTAKPVGGPPETLDLGFGPG